MGTIGSTGFIAIRAWRQEATADYGPAPVVTLRPAQAAGADVGQATPAAPDAGGLRRLWATVSPAPLLRRALAMPDVVRRWAIVTDNLAEDVSPLGQLTLLVPTSRPTTVERGGRRYLAPDSYDRFDALGNAVSSVDPEAFARLYVALRPELERAYRALGYPGASLDQVMARALQRVSGARPPEAPVEVRSDGERLVFADERLESAGWITKQLVRMGPRNTRLVQGKAREILMALHLPLEAATQARSR